jgi:hypothetical protein
MMMMEWERSNSGGFVTNTAAKWLTDERKNNQTLDKSKISPKRTKQQHHFATISDAERRMMNMLLPVDVLLVGKRELKKVAPGNARYNELLKQCRPLFHQEIDRHQKDEIVHTILIATWSQGGRFLLHESLNGTASVLSNALAERAIRQDLAKNGKEAAAHVTATKRKRKGQKGNKSTPKAAAVKKTFNHSKKSKRKRSAKRTASSAQQCTNTKMLGQAPNGVLFGDV